MPHLFLFSRNFHRSYWAIKLHAQPSVSLQNDRSSLSSLSPSFKGNPVAEGAPRKPSSPIASNDNRGKHPVEEKAEGSRSPRYQRHGPRVISSQRRISPPVVTRPGTSKQPAPVSSNSSGSLASEASDPGSPLGSPISNLPYSNAEARRFQKERDEAWKLSHKATRVLDVERLDREHKWRQFCATIDALTEENARLMATANRIADKVNAHGDTPEACLDAVDRRIDEVALHGLHLGASMGLAAMSSHTNEDYSVQPTDFRGGAPKDIDSIDDDLELYANHAVTIVKATDAHSVINRVFQG